MGQLSRSDFRPRIAYQAGARNAGGWNGLMQITTYGGQGALRPAKYRRQHLQRFLRA